MIKPINRSVLARGMMPYFVRELRAARGANLVEYAAALEQNITVFFGARHTSGLNQWGWPDCLNSK